MNDEASIVAAEGLGIELQTHDPLLVKKILVERIAQLLQHDLNHLISLLYRLDIDEAVMKQRIKENEGGDTALVIADLVIERQVRRIATRKQFPGNDAVIDENEKW